MRETVGGESVGSVGGKVGKRWGGYSLFMGEERVNCGENIGLHRDGSRGENGFCGENIAFHGVVSRGKKRECGGKYSPSWGSKSGMWGKMGGEKREDRGGIHKT